jgi:Flp pilus assembly protein TadD
MIIIIAAVMIIAFIKHFLLGIGVILVLIGYFIYRSRASYYALRASNFFAKDDLEQARNWFKKAYDSKPCPENHKVSYGYILLRSGHLEEAESILLHLQQTTKSRDIRIQAECNMATAYWLQGKKEQALAKLEEIYQQYKTSLVYGNYGYFKILNGEAETALAFNLEAYAYNSDDKTIVDNLALNYYLLGQLEGAEEIFQQLMLKSPKYAESYYYYALTLKQLGKIEEAKEQIQSSLGKDLAIITMLTREQIEKEASLMNVSLES